MEINGENYDEEDDKVVNLFEMNEEDNIVWCVVYLIWFEVDGLMVLIKRFWEWF